MAMTRDVMAFGILAMVGSSGCFGALPESSGSSGSPGSPGSPGTRDDTAGAGPASQQLLERRAAADRATRDRLALRVPTAREASARLTVPRLTDEPDWAGALDLPRDIVGDVTLTGPAQAAAVLTNLGVIQPIRGDSFVILSTGIANYGQPGSVSPERGTDFSPSGAEGDSVTLSLTLTVPSGANRMSFQFNFLSAEAPDFNTGQDNIFNDTFSLAVTEPGSDPQEVTVATVNNSKFFLSSDSRAKGTGFDIYAPDPAGVDDSFPGGFPDAGLTDFQAFSTPVVPGSQVQLQFTMKDNGDGILDSAVLIDAIQFSALETIDPNTATPEDNLLGATGSLVASVDALAVGGAAARGVVADGVTELLLRVKVPRDGTVEFSIPDDDQHSAGFVTAVAGGEAAAAIQTAVVAATNGDHYGLAVYRAPKDFNRGGDDDLLERTTTITARYIPPADAGTGFDTAVDIQIRRPPVVLVRGLWSLHDDWNPAAVDPDAASDPRFLINDATFASTLTEDLYLCNPDAQVCDPNLGMITCGSEIAPGANIPGPGALVGLMTRAAVDNVRRLGIAATKADVVAHGTGGIRVRQYIAQAAYANKANLGVGDINRLITIDTPHFGSTIAEKIALARDAIAAPARTAFECNSRKKYNPLEPGDMDALARAALSLPATPVPSHAIIGTGGLALGASTKNNIVPKLITGASVITQTDARLGFKDKMYGTVFGRCDHDLLSDVVSQQGGLPDTAATRVAMTDESAHAMVFRDDPDADYFRSMREPTVNARIKQLLNSPIDSPVFGQFPASSPALRCDPATGQATALSAAGKRDAADLAPAPGAALADTGTLRITSPLDGATVLAGSPLSVTLAAENGFEPTSVLLFTGRSIARVPVVSLTATVTVPKDALGPLVLFAIGFDDQDGVQVTDDVEVHVITNATVQTVRIVTQDPILYSAGQRSQLHVVATYDDGATRDITQGVGTVYLTSSPNIVTVSTDGVITAVGSGTATVIAQNGMHQDSVTVVVKSNHRPLASAGADVSCVCVPSGEPVPVQLDGSGSSDFDGDPLAFTWLEHGVEVASGAAPLVAFAPGLHTIDLVVSDGISEPAHDTVVVALVPDTEPPVLAVVGTARTIECSASYSDDGAVASDACDGELTGAIETHSDVNTGVPGGYHVDYRVHDRAGLVATASRAVTVADTIPPVLAVVGTNPAAAECGLPYGDEGARATDLCAGDLTGALTTTPHVDTAVPGGYTVDYQVRDEAGLVATASRAVTVVDTTAPRLTVLGANPVTVECATRYRDRGATAADLCDGDLTGAITAVSHVNTRVLGNYAVDYQVRDRSGLAAAASRTVVVADRTPPDVTLAAMHKLARHDLRYHAFDLSDCGAAVDACGGRIDIDRAGDIVAMYSDERDRSSVFDPDHDMVILSNSRFLVRDQSNLFGNGRVYEIEFTVRDANHNAGLHSCFIGVTAPFHSGPPIDDGRVFAVRPR